LGEWLLLENIQASSAQHPLLECDGKGSFVNGVSSADVVDTCVVGEQIQASTVNQQLRLGAAGEYGHEMIGLAEGIVQVLQSDNAVRFSKEGWAFGSRPTNTNDSHAKGHE